MVTKTNIESYDCTKPLGGLCWYGADIEFDNSQIRYYFADNERLYTKQEIVKKMYEIELEFRNGDKETITVKPEPHAKAINWMIDIMEVGKTYKITERQKEIILQSWEVVHLSEEFFFKFSRDYSTLKKYKK